MKKLRGIILDCGLTEELKWGKPCYTFQDVNLIMIYGLKESCAIAFFNGALLKDPQGILIKPGPNSQAGRWIKFTSVREIDGMKTILKAYIDESVKAEKAGLKVTFKKTPEPIPEELQNKLDETPALKTAFAALTPDGKEATFSFFRPPNNPKPGRRGLKNTGSGFSVEKECWIGNGAESLTTNQNMVVGAAGI